MDYREKSDPDLVGLCKRGDERAAAELLRRFERPVFSLIYRMVRDRELAEDLAQEAFVRAFNNLGRYDPSFKFSSWLFKVAYNLTIDHLRKKRLDTVSIHGSPSAVTSEMQAAIMELDLPAGPATMQTWFDTDDGTWGNAYYVEAQRLH